MKHLTCARLARALHDQACLDQCGHATGHWKGRLVDAKEILTADHPAAELHARTCEGMRRAKRREHCPDPVAHTRQHAAWLALLTRKDPP